MRLERVEYCWPPLRSPLPLTSVWPTVQRVWNAKGHLILSVSPSPGKYELAAVDAVSSTGDVGARQVGGRQRAVVDTGFGGMAAQPLHSTENTSPIVDVFVANDFDIGVGARDHVQTLCCLRQDGSLELWRYLASTAMVWERVHSGVKLFSQGTLNISMGRVALHSDKIYVVYALAASETDDPAMSDVFLQEVSFTAAARTHTGGSSNAFELNVSLPVAVACGVSAAGGIWETTGGFAIVSAVSNDIHRRGDPDQIYFYSRKKQELYSLVWGASLSTGPDAFHEEMIDYKVGYTPGTDAGARAVAKDAFSDTVRIPHISGVASHPSTHELVVLESTGRLVLCRIADGGVQLQPLCTLPAGTMDTRVLSFALHRTHAIVFNFTSCRVFSIRTGALIREVQYPLQLDSPRVWVPTRDTHNVGMWSAGGAWQLQFDRVLVTAGAEAAGDGSEVLSPAQLDALATSRVWSLRRHRAKHLIDAALELQQRAQQTPLTAEQTSLLLQVVHSLVDDELLESPALVVALLQHLPRFEAPVRELVARFLTVFRGDQASGDSLAALAKADSAEASAAFRAFRTRTPLNDLVEPSLRQWLNEEPQHAPLATDEQLILMARNTATEVDAIVERAIAQFRLNKTPADKADRARMEELVRNEPAIVLASLEAHLKLRSYSEANMPEGDDALLLDSLFAEEAIQEFSFEGHRGRSGRHPLFEQLCSLAIAEDPPLVPLLVQLAHHCSMRAAATLNTRGTAASSTTFQNSSRPMRASRKDTLKNLNSFRRRAIRVVVPVDAADVLGHRDAEGAIEAIVQLLVSAEESSRALRFLLSLERWEQGIALLQNNERDIVEQFELYHTLLTTFLNSPDAAPSPLLERIWEVQPKNYSVYDLIELLKPTEGGRPKSARDGGGSILAGPEDKLNVGHIRDQLIGMFSRETKRR